MWKKKLSLALLCSFSVAHAGTMGEACQAGEVTLPCHEKEWSLSMNVLYAKPLIAGPGIFFDTFDSIQNDWGVGFTLSGGYETMNSGEWGLSWTHLKDNTGTPARFSDVTPLGSLPFSPEMKTEFDRVNALIGQDLMLGNQHQMNMAAGLQYTKMSYQVVSTFEVPVGFPVAGLKQTSTADYNGVGPVATMTYRYALTPQTKAVMKSSASLLVGTARDATAFAYAPTGLVPSSTYGSNKRVVPSLDMQLGVSQSASLLQGSLDVSLMFEALNYFNPFLLPVSAGTLGSSNNYGLMGAYLSFGWHGLC